MSWLRKLGRLVIRPYRLVRDGQADLDGVYPDHPAKASPEQTAVQGLDRRKRPRRRP